MTIITHADGVALANAFLEGFFTGFKANNHEQTLQHLLADKMSWKWSDGAAGEGTSTDVVNVLKNGWAALCADGTYSKPTIVVDGEQGRIVIGHECIGNCTGRLPGSNIIKNVLLHALMVNSNQKVYEWRCIWDNNHKPTVEAAAQVGGHFRKLCNENPAYSAMAKCGIDMPRDAEATQAITREEGEAFAAEYLKGVSGGFAKNNHRETLGHLYADQLSWDWADGTKGSGSKDDLFDILEKSWGPICRDWIPIAPLVAVDTNNRIIGMVFNHCVNLTGGFADETNLLLTSHAQCLHLDEDMKIVKSNISWDNKNPQLVGILAKLAPKLEAAAQVSEGANVTAQGILSGQ